MPMQGNKHLNRGFKSLYIYVSHYQSNEYNSANMVIVFVIVVIMIMVGIDILYKSYDRINAKKANIKETWVDDSTNRMTKVHELPLDDPPNQKQGMYEQDSLIVNTSGQYDRPNTLVALRDVLDLEFAPIFHEIDGASSFVY